MWCDVNGLHNQKCYCLNTCCRWNDGKESIDDNVDFGWVYFVVVVREINKTLCFSSINPAQLVHYRICNILGDFTQTKSRYFIVKVTKNILNEAGWVNFLLSFYSPMSCLNVFYKDALLGYWIPACKWARMHTCMIVWRLRYFVKCCVCICLPACQPACLPARLSVSVVGLSALRVAFLSVSGLPVCLQLSQTVSTCGIFLPARMCPRNKPFIFKIFIMSWNHPCEFLTLNSSSPDDVRLLLVVGGLHREKG